MADTAAAAPAGGGAASPLPAPLASLLAPPLALLSDYQAWWLQVFEDNPFRTGLETALIVFVIYLVFKRPRVTRAESKLTAREADELVAEWEPAPLVDLAAARASGRAIPDTQTAVTVIARKVGATVETAAGATLSDFVTFDFLGLTCDDDVKRECMKVLDKVGCGSCGPRGFYGTLDEHLELEDKIAEFMGVPESISYSDAASTVASVIPAFAKRGDLCIVDEACYDPILTGVMLARCRVVYFKHNDMDDLAAVLHRVAAKDQQTGSSPLTQRRFIVVEGVYRNVGDICPLPELVRLKDEHRCRLIVDESFSFGVLGATGRGVTEHFGVDRASVEILCAALCAALGSVGGFCIGNEHEVVDHQRLQGAGYCFSASAPPFVARAATVALEKISADPSVCADVRANSTALSVGVDEACAGLLHVVSDPESPILHLRVSDAVRGDGDGANENRALQMMAEAMQADHAIFAVASKYTRHHLHIEAGKTPEKRGPAVPTPSLRLAVSALHSAEQIELAVQAIEAVARDAIAEVYGVSAKKAKKKTKAKKKKAASRTSASSAKKRTKTPRRKSSRR